jgi:predicted TIM-barrel fold metal-dependent hydrolase
MIIDAHHHLWDPARADYPSLTDDLAVIRRPSDRRT